MQFFRIDRPHFDALAMLDERRICTQEFDQYLPNVEEAPSDASSYHES